MGERMPNLSDVFSRRAERWRATPRASPDRRFEALLLASASIVWWTDARGEFVEEQPYWAAYTGQSWEQYRGSGWLTAVHPDDRASIAADWASALGKGSTYVTQGRIWSARHDRYRAFQTRGIPARNDAGEITEWLGALTDVQDAVDIQTVLRRTGRDFADALNSLRLSESRRRESEERYRLLVEQCPDAIFVASEDGHFCDVNPAGCDMLRLSREEILATTFFEFFAPDEHARVPVEIGKLAGGGVVGSEWRVIRRDQSLFFAEILARKLPDGLLQAVVRDTTERRQKEEQTRLLNREINHRFKNLLAVVNAIAGRTEAADIGEYRARLFERLRALSESTDLLVGGDWKGVALVELVSSQLGHIRGGRETRITYGGPDLLLSPSAAQLLGMALHELATNAIKHGALSTERGRVEIAWTLSGSPDAELLSVKWSEQDGPEVRPSKNLGFGSALLHQVRSALKAKAELRFDPGGVEWRADIPVAEIKAPMVP